jgi:hypothetical protein
MSKIPSLTLRSLFKNEMVSIPTIDKEVSVVGNAGSLLKSNHGAEINNSGYVIRCNDAPANTNRNDIRIVAHSAVNNMKTEHFRNCKYCIVWYPKQFEGTVVGPMSKFRNLPTKFISLTDPNLASIYLFYTKLTGIPKIDGIWVSTGFFAFSIGQMLAKRVKLFGFGAFAGDPNAPFHYYGNLRQPQGYILKTHRNHKFLEEARGIIKFKEAYPDRLLIYK